MDRLLIPVVESLVADVALPRSLRDHALSGTLAGYRECHLKTDLLLLYSLPVGQTLRLVRLGSHRELFG